MCLIAASLDSNHDARENHVTFGGIAGCGAGKFRALRNIPGRLVNVVVPR
jgi:hypothetical protein